MERKLLTVLMLAAFGTNGLNGSLIDPNAKPSPATPYVLQSRYPQGGAVANVGKRLVEELRQAGWDGYAKAVEAAEAAKLNEQFATFDDGLGGISSSPVSKASGQAATLTAKVRKLAGKALNATKSGLTQGKKAVVRIPSALAGDYAALTADVTGSGFGFPVAAAQLFGNAWNNKIAALKVAAATAATAYVGLKGATWVAGKAKSLYQARLAKSAPAAAALEEVPTSAERPATAVDGAASTSPVVTASVVESSPAVAPAVARAVVEDPTVAVREQLTAPVAVVEYLLCEEARLLFHTAHFGNIDNRHLANKYFTQYCQANALTAEQADLAETKNAFIDLYGVGSQPGVNVKARKQLIIKYLKALSPELAPQTESTTSVDDTIVTEEPTTTPTDSVDKQQAVGRSLIDRARSLASRWWTPSTSSKTSDDAAIETTAALEDAIVTPAPAAAEDATTTATVAPEAPKASRWSAWWPRSSKAPVAQEETAEQAAARLSKEKAAHEEAATLANQRPTYEFTGK